MNGAARESYNSHEFMVHERKLGSQCFVNCPCLLFGAIK